MLQVHAISSQIWGDNMILGKEATDKMLAAVREFTEHYDDPKACRIATISGPSSSTICLRPRPALQPAQGDRADDQQHQDPLLRGPIQLQQLGRPARVPLRHRARDDAVTVELSDGISALADGFVANGILPDVYRRSYE